MTNVPIASFIIAIRIGSVERKVSKTENWRACVLGGPSTVAEPVTRSRLVVKKALLSKLVSGIQVSIPKVWDQTEAVMIQTRLKHSL